MGSLSNKAGLLIVANGLKYAIGFILPMVLVRLLSQEDYGTYQQLSLVSSAATGILVLGLPTSIYYFYHRATHAQDGRATLIAQTQVMLLLSGIMTAVLIVLMAGRIADHMNNSALRGLLPTYAIYVGFFIAGEHFMHVMISQNRYGLAVGLEAVETVFRVTLMVGLLAMGFGLPALVGALVVYAVLRLVGRSYWLWHGPDSVKGARWTGRFPAEQLAYSLPLAATTCIGLLGGLLDRAIVALSFTTVDYAIYTVGALEIPLDVIFQSSVLNVLRASLPALVQEGNIAEVIRIWRESVRKLALIVIPSLVFLSFNAGLFITVLFTSQYAESVNVFHVYLGLLPLHMLVLSVVPQVYGRTRLNLYVVAIAVGTNTLLSLLLLRWIGILGPAVALVVSSYLGSSLYLVVTMRLLKAKASQLLPVVPILRTLAASTAALAPAALAASFGGHTLLGLALGGAGFGVGYLVFGLLFRAFTDTDVALARRLLNTLAGKLRG